MHGRGRAPEAEAAFGWPTSEFMAHVKVLQAAAACLHVVGYSECFFILSFIYIENIS